MLAQLVFTAVNCASGTCAVPATTQIVTVPAPQVVVSTPQVVTVPAPQVVAAPVVVSSGPATATVQYKRGLFGRLKPVSASVVSGGVCNSCK